MNIGLVTDSTADLPAEMLERHEIRMIPAILNLGENSYRDGEGITREEFYRQLPGMKFTPTTASPSVGSFQECYEGLLSKGKESILSIHPSKNLSGIFNAARLAAEGFGQRVHVVDSGQLSLGLGFQMLAAAEAHARGVVLDEILQMVEGIKKRVRVAALLDSMEYLRRSGRVSWAKAVMGGLLNLKPLIGLRHGVVERIGLARTRAQGVQRLVGDLVNWGKMERLGILHTNAEDDARKLLEELHPEMPHPALVVNVTTVIGTHVGPNGVGLAAVPVE